MPDRHRKQSSSPRKTVRWFILAVLLFAGVSSFAPVYASDCSRWIAEYKQGILQRRAARRLRAAKYRLTTLVQKPAPARKHPVRHRMGPLEALKRFQIDCGDVDTPPLLTAKAPEVPLEPLPLVVAFPDQGPPEFPAPALTEIAEVPPLADTPLTPVLDSPLPSPVPEPSSLLLVMTGAVATTELLRRKNRNSVA